jgi:hypothetical protein
MKILGAIAHHLLKGAACVLLAASVVYLPAFLGELISSVQWNDPARCTLDAPLCDKLRPSR